MTSTTEPGAAAVTIEDYNTEFDSFYAKLTQNKKTCQKILSTYTRDISSVCQQHIDIVNKAKGACPFSTAT